MTRPATVRDLVVLVPGIDDETAIRTILSQSKKLRIRAMDFKGYTHQDRDGGCRIRGHHFLQGFSKQFTHALVLFDREGCGDEAKTRTELEEEVQRRLAASG